MGRVVRTLGREGAESPSRAWLWGLVVAVLALTPANGSAQWFGSVEGQVRAFPENALFEIDHFDASNRSG